MRGSFHNLIRDELANCINERTCDQRWMAATEVPVGSHTYDVVAVLCGPEPYARVYEVKTARADLQAWLKRETWKEIKALGADVWLVVPESLVEFVPEMSAAAFQVAVRMRSGKLGGGHQWCTTVNERRPSADLFFGVIKALRRLTVRSQIGLEIWSDDHEDTEAPVVGMPVFAAEEAS